MAIKKRNLVYKSDYGDGDVNGPFKGYLDNNSDDLLIIHPNGKVGLTGGGGLAIKLTNKTSASSVKGTLVDTHTSIINAFEVTGANEEPCIGVVYEDGISDGEECWIVCSGRAQVLLQNSTAATFGYWARTSITAAGRVDITNASPPGGGITEIDRHMREVGHCMETVSAGTNKLAWVILHFN